MAVEKWRKSSYFKPRQQLVRELGRILARIGDEDLELLGCTRVTHRLPDKTFVAAVRARVADEHVVGIVRHVGPVPTNPVVASLLAETHSS